MLKQLFQSRTVTLFFLLLSGAALGTLSLFFSAVFDRWTLFLSYFQIPLIIFLNLAPVILLVFLIYCLCGRAWISFLLSSIFVMSLSLVNWFKLRFRDDPFLFEDILLIKEAGNMAGKYQIFLTTSMVVSLVLIVLGTLFLFFCCRGTFTLWPRLGGLAILLLLAIPLKPLYTDSQIYTEGTANNSLINQWSATEVYVSKGFVYPFLYSISATMDSPPKIYEEQRAKTILSAYETADIPEDQKVSVLTVMLESYADFSKFDQLDLDPSVYALYHALEAEGVSGNLVTNIFAGGTVDSERSYLKGFSTLGSFRSPSNSYPWYFRDQGYTVEGAHPCFSWFYNRLNINENLGFQSYHFVENYFSPMTNGEVGLDNIFFPSLIDLWKSNKVENKPYFAYHLSYQGHGPYNTDRTWFGDDNVSDRGYTTEELNILNNYFGSIRNTNEHLSNFIDYYRTETEPVVIVLFGDHMPWLGDSNSVYQTLGINLDVSTEEGFFNYYSTRYLIWANDAAKATLGQEFSGIGPDIGPYFLMNEVFRQCGWKGPAFMQATAQLMDRVGIISTPTGLFVENGSLTSTLSAEGQALLEDFRMLEYYYRKNFEYQDVHLEE